MESEKGSKAVGGEQVCHQQAQVEGGQVWGGQGCDGGHGEVWEEGVVFTGAEKVVEEGEREKILNVNFGLFEGQNC